MSRVEAHRTRMPLRHHDGQLPLEDHGAIGDGHTLALVGRNGSIDWLCLPRFDSPPVFCRLLDVQRGGELQMAPDHILDARQYYEPDTAVLVTELRGPHGLLRITDACLLEHGADLGDAVGADRGELQRVLQVLYGRVHVRVLARPFGRARHERLGDGLRVRLEDRPELDLRLWSTHAMEGPEGAWDLREGDEAVLSLSWKPSGHRCRATSPHERLDATRSAWRRWIREVRYDGPHASMVRRSAITLKLLDYFREGSMVAAATSSLPEWIGGTRNWDYRYTWIRDAAFAVHALRRIGMGFEASAFLGWVLDAVEACTRPCVMYTLDGAQVPEEKEDGRLRGYLDSAPVRWGNHAAHQRQHDVFGEVMDCAYQWARHGGRISEPLWAKLCELAEWATREWHQPDHGIWEVRSRTRPFTYSAALCQVALDRIAEIARMQELPGPVHAWRHDAERIRQGIVQGAWDPQRGFLRAHLEGGDLDASLLALPLRRVLDARHPRMLATTRAIASQLSAGDGLLYRYLPDRSPDGVEGDEGAFLLCSFWHVENLILQGEADQAASLLDGLCARANPVGLLAEQVRPSDGAFLGNLPQAMSHVGLISAAVRLDRFARHNAGR